MTCQLRNLLGKKAGAAEAMLAAPANVGSLARDASNRLICRRDFNFPLRLVGVGA
jgi:hypothetical protein